VTEAGRRAMVLRPRAKTSSSRRSENRSASRRSSAHNAVIGLMIGTAEPLAWTPGPSRLVLEERKKISLEATRPRAARCLCRCSRPPPVLGNIVPNNAGVALVQASSIRTDINSAAMVLALYAGIATAASFAEANLAVTSRAAPKKDPLKSESSRLWATANGLWSSSFRDIG
jgi:hypothetical protein